MSTTFNGRTPHTGRSASADPSTLTTERATVTRVIRPPRHLPGTRAVLGGLLVTVAAVATFVVATGGETGPHDRYVVAKHVLSPGTVIGPDDLAVVALDLPPAQGAVAFTDIDELRGAVARGTIGPDELIDRTDVALPAVLGEAPPRYREVSFAVPRARALDGAFSVGDRVDVVASSKTETTVVTAGATVIAVSGGRNDSLTGNGDLVITLAVGDGRAAIAVAHGGANGELSVLRATRADNELPASYKPASTTSLAPATTAPASR